MGLVVTYYMPADGAGDPGGPWSEDLSGAVRLGTMAGIIDEAELGAVGQSSLLFDDHGGTLGTSHYSDGIRGLKRLWIDETAVPSGNQRVFTGWIADRHYLRGGGSHITGVNRTIDVTLVDSNTMLSFRVFAPVNGSNATEYNASNSFIRPAETDLQRVAALLTVPFLTSVHDTGFISTGTGVAMDAADYTGQHPADVLNDCAQQSGRNFFIRYDESVNEFSLHYVDEGDLTDAATIQISNVLADVDNVTTFAPEPDLELVRDPSRISAAVYLPFNGSNSPAYKTRIQTEYDYGWRDSSAPSSNVKTLAKANVRALRYLNTTKTEDDRITCTLRGLPASKVTAIKQGQVVQAKFSHLPNGSNATWGPSFQPLRVLNRNVMANEQTNVLYNVRYELSPISSTTGFHQCVLVSYRNDQTSNINSGTEILTWGGQPAGGRSPAILFPPVVQDTDGYSGTAGDMQYGGPQIDTLVIPVGLGGTYRVGMEGINVNNAWWPNPIPGGLGANPQPVSYIPNGTDTSLGDDACGPCSASLEVRVNGSVVASDTWTDSRGLTYKISAFHVDATITVSDGDVVTTSVTPSGIYQNNALGGQVPGALCGVFYLTWLHA